ncbi:MULTISPECIES: flagellar protein FlgN [unclassified Microbacterium]|uniref:flagellar protein FlgN n=1 Tax=unclassified Microbacterium TaxID=2609290 RepID=UPI0016055ABD|nr:MULTISPECIES: flagellar protein FlgN [unclassified Microbacterium]QNA91688.1 flagellar protein FlgN [Microbacterium sp. Se63.02b]QYM64878.1 hypothetical protein K1X59_03105 [Microbacterium sp. Se5.02b]
MGDGVKLRYDDLEPLRTALQNIIEEFENAGSRSNDLESAVGSPYGERALRDAASDFEGRWDDRRKRLMDDCKKVEEHVAAVITGFQDFDRDAASKSENNGG